MQTVRRLYLYLVTLIGLVVVIWGVIYLARTLFDARGWAFFSRDLLATGLSLILVGLPVFLLHWLVIQRQALRDVDERSTMIRAAFLYAVQLAVLIPIVQNVLAIFTRMLMPVMNMDARLAFIGGQQNLIDNLVAIIANLVAWAYFYRILRNDWSVELESAHLLEVRRMYRYIWMFYGLVFAVAGVQNLLRFLVSTLAGTNLAINAWLGNGVPLALVGGVIWGFSWRTIQQSDDDPNERRSTLRLVALYVITLISAGIVFGTGISTLTEFWRWVLGVRAATSFVTSSASQLALLAPVAILWLYYERHRKEHLRSGIEPARQPGAERVYRYILSFLGMAGTFAGLLILVDGLIRLAFGVRILLARDVLAPSLASLMVSLPLWLLNWVPMQNHARQTSHAGEGARRSLVRKIYLYLILFLSIIGVMLSGGTLFYLVLSNLFGATASGFWQEFVQRLSFLLIIALWLTYHLVTLRKDGAQTQRTLTDRHVCFPALIFQRGEDDFAGLVVDALQRQAPLLPVAVHRVETTPLSEELLSAKAVVIPSSLAIHSPEALRVWLSEYRGTQIFVPQPKNGWTYLSTPPRTQLELAQDTARLLKDLAEGQDARRPTQLGPWAIAGIVIAGIIAIPPLLALVLSFAFRGFD
jgi:hypothetical protein